MVDFIYTRSKRLRGTRPDAIKDGTAYLIKNVSTLRATYQIRLCAFFALKNGTRLCIRVPKRCRVMPTLQKLLNEHLESVVLERF
jgi:hypothetical protein